jgi:putative chitinase
MNTPPIAAAELRRLAPHLKPERVALFATVLNQACGAGDIVNERRLCHFLGQSAEETGGFSGLVESTSYTDPQRLDALFKNVHGIAHAQRLIAEGPAAIANTIYAGKLGNGDPASGDGFRYRGRGFLQLTGRDNYRKIGALIGMDLEDNPDQLGEPGPAALAAGLFWKLRGINTPAEADDVAAVTKLVNGGACVGLTQRIDWHAKAKGIWPY